MTKNPNFAVHHVAPQLRWLTRKGGVGTELFLLCETIAMPYSFAILATGAMRHDRVGLLEIDKCEMGLFRDLGNRGVLLEFNNCQFA